MLDVAGTATVQASLSKAEKKKQKAMRHAATVEEQRQHRLRRNEEKKKQHAIRQAALKEEKCQRLALKQARAMERKQEEEKARIVKRANKKAKHEANVKRQAEQQKVADENATRTVRVIFDVRSFLTSVQESFSGCGDIVRIRVNGSGPRSNYEVEFKTAASAKAAMSIKSEVSIPLTVVPSPVNAHSLHFKPIPGESIKSEVVEVFAKIAGADAVSLVTLGKTGINVSFQTEEQLRTVMKHMEDSTVTIGGVPIENVTAGLAPKSRKRCR